MKRNHRPTSTASPRVTSWGYLGLKDLAAMAFIAILVLTFAVHVWSQHRAAAANLHCPPGTQDMSQLPHQPGSTVQCGDSISVQVGSKP